MKISGILEISSLYTGGFHALYRRISCAISAISCGRAEPLHPPLPWLKKNSYLCSPQRNPILNLYMEITICKGTDPYLYQWVGPLVMDKAVIKYNNNYPFKTAENYAWHIAHEGGQVLGFVPMELRKTRAIFNNYYVAKDSPEVLEALLRHVKDTLRDVPHRGGGAHPPRRAVPAQWFRTFHHVEEIRKTDVCCHRKEKANVYELAVQRLDRVFRDFDNIYVSFSGGKDSGALLNMCIDYIRRNGLKRKIGVYHMDYEVQYAETTKYVERMWADNADVLEVYHVCAVQSAYVHVHVPNLLAAVGRWLPRAVGARDARLCLHEGRLRLLQGGHVGLRLPEHVRPMVSRAQEGVQNVLPHRHTHSGELQPLAHHLLRAAGVALQGLEVDQPPGGQRIQRLRDVRLAHHRCVDGQWKVRLGLQSSV